MGVARTYVLVPQTPQEAKGLCLWAACIHGPSQPYDSPLRTLVSTDIELHLTVCCIQQQAVDAAHIHARLQHPTKGRVDTWVQDAGQLTKIQSALQGGTHHHNRLCMWQWECVEQMLLFMPQSTPCMQC